MSAKGRERSPSQAQASADRLREKLDRRASNPTSVHSGGDSSPTAVNEETLDPYGFIRSPNYDHATYDEFVEAYLPVLTRRTMRWNHQGAAQGHIPSHSRKLKRFVRKGIPSSLRQAAWLSVSGADQLLQASPGLFERLKDGSALAPNVLTSIELDLRRTLTDNVYFRGGEKQLPEKLSALRNVLIAVAKHRPAIGYCQGLNFIVASILLVVDAEEEAFWLMVALLDRLPDYYGENLGGLRMDCFVLQQLVRQKLPRLHEHFLRHSCSIDLFATRWFINLFLDCLPQETAFRVLDCLFYEGSKILFRVALTILAHEENALLACRDIGDLLTFMKEILTQKWMLHCHEFMRLIFEVPQPLPGKEIRRLRKQAATDPSL